MKSGSTCFSENRLYTPTAADNATVADADDSESTLSGSQSSESQSSQSSEGTANSSLSGSSGLSTGAQAGTGVGVTCGVLVIAGLIFWNFRRRRLAARKLDQKALPDYMAEKDGTEVEGAAMLGTEGQRHELEQPLTEMPLGHEAQELPAKHGRVEVGRSLSSKAPEGIEQRHEMPTDEVLGERLSREDRSGSS